MTLADISNIVVSSYMGSLVHLRDIAEVAFTYEDMNYKGRVGGTRAVFLTVKQKENLNIFKISGELEPVIRKM